MGKFGETRVGKSGMLELKAAVSLKRVKIKEKLLWRAYWKLLVDSLLIGTMVIMKIFGKCS